MADTEPCCEWMCSCLESLCCGIKLLRNLFNCNGDCGDCICGDCNCENCNCGDCDCGDCDCSAGIMIVGISYDFGDCNCMIVGINCVIRLQKNPL